MRGAETFRTSAEAYDRLVGRYCAQLANALIGFAGVEPEMRALDVGCGPGALTAALAERLGSVEVCGADPSAVCRSMSRQAAGRRGRGGAPLRQGRTAEASVLIAS